jgi:hypothetical protein
VAGFVDRQVEKIRKVPAIGRGEAPDAIEEESDGERLPPAAGGRHGHEQAKIGGPAIL